MTDETIWAVRWCNEKGQVRWQPQLPNGYRQQIFCAMGDCFREFAPPGTGSPKLYLWRWWAQRKAKWKYDSQQRARSVIYEECDS